MRNQDPNMSKVPLLQGLHLQFIMLEDTISVSYACTMVEVEIASVRSFKWHNVVQDFKYNCKVIPGLFMLVSDFLVAIE